MDSCFETMGSPALGISGRNVENVLASLPITDQLYYEARCVTQLGLLPYLSGCRYALIQGLCQSGCMVHAHSYASHMVARQRHLSQAGHIISAHFMYQVHHLTSLLVLQAAMGEERSQELS